MNFTGFMQVIPKPTHWWRRPHQIHFSLWPAWLAQALCPHKVKTYFTDDQWRCDDCFKFNFHQKEDK